MPRWLEGTPSGQQVAVLALLVEGMTNDEIGRRLGIGEHTVKEHVSAMLRKSGAANRAELAARAIAEGVVPPPPELPEPEGGKLGDPSDERRTTER